MNVNNCNNFKDFRELARRRLPRPIFDYIDGKNDSFEYKTLPILSSKKIVSAYKHFGFWQPMDTLRDKNILCELWNKNEAPW